MSRYFGQARTHGRIATYIVGCRCDDCRTAAATHRRRARIAQAERQGRGHRSRTNDWVADYRAGRTT